MLFVFAYRIDFLCAQTVSAASLRTVPTNDSYAAKDRTVGGAVFVSGNYHAGVWNLFATKGGASVKISENFNGGEILTDGNKVYFAEKKSGKWYLSFYYLKTSGAKQLGILSKTAENVDLCGYYKNKVYFIINVPEGSFACFNTKNQSVKKLASGYSVTIATQYGKYFVMTDGTGAGYSYLGVLNAATNKMKKVATSPGNWIVTSKYIYYIRITKGWIFEAPNTISVGRYTIASGKNKTLVKSLKNYGIQKFTTKYVKYKNSKGKVKTKRW